jgi:2-polyprenyl-6-methoxyphenol hydroxylase-like FAD-dependent oxidoreductase
MARPGFIFPFATMCGFMLHFAIMFTLIGTDVAIAHQHHKGHIGHILPDTPTNSCTIAWFSPTANPTAVTPSRPNNLSLWSLRTAVADDLDTEDMDENELELYRIDKIKSAIQSAECIADDWPELDLQWCLADWHDGKLVPESR